MKDKSNDNENTGSSLDALREYGIDVSPLEEGYNSKDAIIKYGKKLRKMREDAVMTQSALANAADMSQADISRLEKGLGKVGPSLDTMNRLAHACRQRLSVSHENLSRQTEGKTLSNNDYINALKALKGAATRKAIMSKESGSVHLRPRRGTTSSRGRTTLSTTDALRALSFLNDKKALEALRAIKNLSDSDLKMAIAPAYEPAGRKYKNLNKA